MMDGAGSIGLRHWRGRRARRRTNQWLLGNLIAKVHAQELETEEGSALHAVAWHRDLEGELLDRRMAAVELQNVLRPTVGVARFIVFAALALHEHPEYRQKLKDGDDDFAKRFVQEVRRFYPFFPFLVARARKGFDWCGYRFQQDQQVLLDLYGTNRDERIWNAPEKLASLTGYGWWVENTSTMPTS